MYNWNGKEKTENTMKKKPERQQQRREKKVHTHTTVVLNNDRLVGRIFDDATVDTGCKELARRLGGG